MEKQILRRLPLGLSDFGEVITNNYLYVDKTELIHQLVSAGKYYFLSRPRRFGKSLLISTLAALFAGKKELFKNLWIYSSSYDWSEFGVIRIDFSEIDYSNGTVLEKSLCNRLQKIAQAYKKNLPVGLSAKDMLSNLVDELAHERKAVLLIDEYDKPILDHLDNTKQAKEMREFLRNFYATIKAKDAQLCFVLLTGVTKFSHTSIFSGLNNLNDISLDGRYATLLGYTKDELVRYFTPHIELLAHKSQLGVQETLEQITQFYDGYQFAEHEEHVFNPYSVMRCFDKNKFGRYWFATGTPTFLITLLQQRNYSLASLAQPVINELALETFDVENIPFLSVLLQTGYLTIKDYDDKTRNYTLGVPNKEVHDGLTMQLVDAFTQLPTEESIQYAKLLTQAFAAGNMVELGQKLQEFFNRTPYVVHITDENKLQFVVYSIFALMGVAVDPEVMTSLGRADLVVQLPKYIYIIELKFNGSAQNALEQIKDKKYYEKYVGGKKEIVLLGINFESKTKTVSLESSTPDL